MKLMKTTEAVGQVLCHDITQIIPGVKKDAVFRKGHIITKEDIPVLLSVGKETIYIWENDETMMPPVQILSSYKTYSFRTRTGDKFGMTTFAPACKPNSLPCG